MAWKDKYAQAHGDLKIDYTPSEPETWKDTYLRRLQERDEAETQREKLAQQRAEEQEALEEERAAQEKADTEVYKKQQALYDIALEMQDTAYLSELDRKKRSKSGSYQNYYDAEERRYKYAQKESDYLSEAQELIDYLRGYPEDEYDSKDLIKMADAQINSFGVSLQNLADETEYWKQFADKDAYEDAMRTEDIENRRQKAERMQAYADSGQDYIPGLGLDKNQTVHEMALSRLMETQETAANPYAEYTQEDDFEELSQLGAGIDNSTGVTNKITAGRANSYKQGMYKDVTEDQEKMYNYLLVKEGEERADEYLKSIGINDDFFSNALNFTVESAKELGESAFDMTIGKLMGTTLERLQAESEGKSGAGALETLKAGVLSAGGQFNDAVLDVYANAVDLTQDALGLVGIESGKNYARELQAANAENWQKAITPVLENGTWLENIAMNTVSSAINSKAMMTIGTGLSQQVGSVMGGGLGTVNPLLTESKIAFAGNVAQMTPFAIQSVSENYENAKENGATTLQAVASGLGAGLMSLATNSAAYDEYSKRLGLGVESNATMMANISGAYMAANWGEGAITWLKNALTSMGVAEGLQEVSESLAIKLSNDMWNGTVFDTEEWNEWTQGAREEFLYGYLSGALFYVSALPAYAPSRLQFNQMVSGETETTNEAIGEFIAKVAEDVRDNKESVETVLGDVNRALTIAEKVNGGETLETAREETQALAEVDDPLRAAAMQAQAEDGRATGAEDTLMAAAEEMAEREARMEAQRREAEARAQAQVVQQQRERQTQAGQQTMAQPEQQTQTTGEMAFGADSITFKDGTALPATYELNQNKDIVVQVKDNNGNVAAKRLVEQGTQYYDQLLRTYEQSRAGEQTAQKAGNTAAKAESVYRYVEQAYSKQAYSALDAAAQRRVTDSLTVMNAMAERGGVNVRIVDSITGTKNGEAINSGANGRYLPGENTIEIALDAQDGAYEYIAVHELTHFIQNKSEADYGVLTDFVMETLAKNGEDADALVQAEMERTGAPEDIARAEVIANSIPAILSDEATVRRLVETDRNLAQRMYDFIRQLIADIRAAGQKLMKSASWRQMESLQNDLESLQEISDLFMGALDSAAVQGKTVNDTARNENDTPFSVKDQEVIDKAVDIFGTTSDPVKAGFMLPSGDLLNFAGAGKTREDHSVIHKAFDYNGTNGEKTKSVSEFMDIGNIRLFPEAASVNIAKAPTESQYSALIDYYDYFKGKQRIVAYKMFNDAEAGSTKYNGAVSAAKIVNDIRTYFNSGTVEKDSSGAGEYRFSLKDVNPDESADALIRENEQLKKANALLQAQFTLTQGRVVSDAGIERLAGKVLREYQSRYDRQTLIHQLRELFDYLGQTETPNWQDVQSVGVAIGGKIIDESVQVDKTSYEAYADVRDMLRTTNITLNEGQRQEAAYLADTYDNYRKQVFGSVRLTNEGTPLDVLWTELSEMHPELFPAEISDAAMPEYLLNAVEGMKPQYSNPYEMNRQEAANDVFMRLYEAYADLPEVRTFADAQKAKYDELNGKYKSAVQDFREESKRRYDQKLSEIRRENIRKRQVLARKIREEKNEQMKAALRRQYRTLSTQNAEKLAKAKARYSKWIDTDRAKEKYSVRIEKSAKDLVQWLTKPTDAKHVPEKLKDVVRDFVETLDFAGDKTTIKANEWRMRMELVQKAFERIDRGDFDNLAFFADIDPDFVPRLEAFLENSEGIKAVYEMDGEQLREMNYLIASMKRTIEYANSLHDNARFATVAEAAEQTQAELDARKEAKLLGQGSELIRDLFNADQLDAFAYQDQLGAAGGTMIQAMRDGMDKKIRNVKETEEYAKGVIGKENIKAWSKEEKTFRVTGGSVTLTTTQIMELYLLNQRQQARGHIYMGGIKTEKMNRPVKVKSEDVTAICATLTSNQREVADGLQRFASDTVAGWGNAVSMELYGYKKFTEKNYWKIKTDENYVRSQDEQSKGGGYYRLKNLGMTKTTVEKASNPILIGDVFDTFTQHVDEMTSYNAFVIPASDAMKWFNYKDELGSTKQSIERALGRGGKEYFTTLIKDVNGFKMEHGRSIGEAMLRNAKIAAVGANLRVVVQQPTAYMRAANMISPKYLAAGLAKPPSIAKSKQYCPIALWKSYGFYDLNIGKGLKEILIGTDKVTDKLRNAALLPASMADEITWGYLWNACEAETKALRKDLDVRSTEFYEAVGKRMSEIVDRTQVVDSMFHRSQLMRKKGIMQLYTTFMSEPTKTYNMIRTAAATVARNPQDKAAWAKLTRALSTYAMTGLFTAAAAGLVDAVRDNEDEDEDGNERGFTAKWNTAFGKNAIDILNPLNMIPVLREIGSALQGYSPSRLDLKGLDMAINAAKAWNTYFGGTSTKSLYGLTYQTAAAMSYITGVPVGNFMRATEGTYKVLTGRTLDKENETATAAKGYATLYQAMLDGNKTTINRLRADLRSGTSKLTPKSNAEIDAGIAEQLMLNEPKIMEAYEAKMAGDMRKLFQLRTAVTNMGFTGEMFDKAVSHMESVMNPGANNKDLDKELNVKLFSTDDLVQAIQKAAVTGDESSLSLIYSELLADSTAQDPVKTTKSNITELIKPIYLEYYEKGDAGTMYALENVLVLNYGYETSEFNSWIKAYNKKKTE